MEVEEEAGEGLGTAQINDGLKNCFEIHIQKTKGAELFPDKGGEGLFSKESQVYFGFCFALFFKALSLAMVDALVA